MDAAAAVPRLAEELMAAVTGGAAAPGLGRGPGLGPVAAAAAAGAQAPDSGGVEQLQELLAIRTWVSGGGHSARSLLGMGVVNTSSN